MQYLLEVRSRPNPLVLIKRVDVSTLTKKEREDEEEKLEIDFDKRYYIVKTVTIAKNTKPLTRSEKIKQFYLNEQLNDKGKILSKNEQAKTENILPMAEVSQQKKKGEKRKIVYEPEYFYKVEPNYSPRQIEILKELGLDKKFLK